MTRILTGALGSYPKPRHLMQGLTGADLLGTSGRAFRTLGRRLGEEQFERMLSRAVEAAIDDQEEAGLDILTDGEQRRGHYLYDVVRHLEGAQEWSEPHAHGDPFPRLVVGSDLRHGRPIIADHFRSARKLTQRTLKATLPGPVSVVDAVHNRRYRSSRALGLAYADAIREEARALRAAGCTLLQLDEPGLLKDLKRAESWGIEAVERCVSGVEGLTTIVHVCRSSERGRAVPSKRYAALLELLNASALDQVSLEARRCRLDPTLLRRLDRKVVVLGCIDVLEPRVETVEEIRDWVRSALDHVPPERLQLAPDCGMAQLGEAQARTKLIHMVRAARSVGD